MTSIPLRSPTLEELRTRQSVKWQTYPADIIPAWIAEMDFDVAQPIRDAVTAQVTAGDLGYPQPEPDALREEVVRWMARDHAWDIQTQDIVVIPDVVRGVELAILTQTARGDRVAVQTPSYPPLLHAVRDHGREVVEVPMTLVDGSWDLNLAAIERTLSTGTRMLIISSPNNPTGKVYTRAELAALIEVSRKHRAVIVSDEIHAPFTHDPQRHVPTAIVTPDAQECTITVTSPSKAWNLAGLRCAQMILPDTALRRRVLELPVKLRKGSSILGITAGVAALREGSPWLSAIREQLLANRSAVTRFLHAYPQVGYEAPEAGYLAWLDVSQVGIRSSSPAEHFLHSGLALSPGEDFGMAGIGHVRLNFGTPPAVLSSILERLAAGLAAARVDPARLASGPGGA